MLAIIKLLSYYRYMPQDQATLTMLSTRQPAVLISALKVAAAKSGKSMSEMIREALEAALKRKGARR